MYFTVTVHEPPAPVVVFPGQATLPAATAFYERAGLVFLVAKLVVKPIHGHRGSAI